MERAKWTDALIDERMAAMDEKFDRQFEESRMLRAEMRSGFSELRAEMHSGFSGLRAEMQSGISELRAEMQSGFSELRAEIAASRADLWAFQKQVLSIVAGFAIALIGLLGAFVAAQF
jgi:hypothetical protein